jgi:outer membrane receptor protein involved in Fe transport
VYGSTDSFDWIVGGYYFPEQGSNWDPSVTLGSAASAAERALPLPEASKFPNYGLTKVSGDNKSKSVFGQTTYNFADQGMDALSLTVGARATTQAGLSRTFKPDYTDIQRLLSDPGKIPITTVTTNAGEAEINGAELELTLLPLEGLELSAFYSYTNAKFVKFIAPDGSDLSHNPMARAPENTYSATIRYTLPLPTEVGEVSLQANYWHTDEYSSSDNVDPVTMLPSYGLLNLRTDWQGVLRSDFDLALFCNNATGEEYEYGVISLYNSLGFSARTPGAPRTVGLEAKYRFGVAAQ